MIDLRGTQVLARLPKIPPAAAPPVGPRTFRLEDATPADWLLCKELNADGTLVDDRPLDENGQPAGEIPVVKVAKAWELQRTHQDGQVDTLRRLHTFDGSLLQVVQRHDITEIWDIVPPFQVGDQIQASQVAYSGVLDGAQPVTLMDDNQASRAWTVLD